MNIGVCVVNSITASIRKSLKEVKIRFCGRLDGAAAIIGSGGKPMSTAPVEDLRLGPESAGLLMDPEEFDAVEDYDPAHRYELINGVLVVSPIPAPEETGPNELLGHLLIDYKEHHPQGSALDSTLPQQYV
jgi:hypothetical protein